MSVVSRSEKGVTPMNDDDEQADSPQIRRLKAAAQNLNIATAVAELPGGALVNWLQDQTDAYMAWAGDKWSDDGLAAWAASRQAEMDAALRADVAIVTGDMAQPRPKIEAPSREAILAAADALEAEEEERGSMHPRHMAVLFTALISRRSPYIAEVEREMAVYRGPNDRFTEHLLHHRADLKGLFRSEIQKVIREARGD
jgi:hypothetical protein